MSANVARHLAEAAARHPDRAAVVRPDDASIDFAQLDAETDRFADHFLRSGLEPGDRAIVLVRPGFAFVPTLFGCFRAGVIPVCLDPGMKAAHAVRCAVESKPSALIGPKRALLAARVFARPLAQAKAIAVPEIRPGEAPKVPARSRSARANDTAAILFTSGSTGVPKGVVYEHGAFDEQRRLLKECFGIQDGERDLVAFPLFALFAAAWGSTALLPSFNPARPARADGGELARLIRKHRVTHTAGSPALWKNLSSYCLHTGTRLPSLRRILMAGAQVPEKLIRDCRAIFPGEVFTPYGATEALPLTAVSAREIAAVADRTRRGAGTCVGKPIAGVDVAILPLVEAPIPRWNEALRLPAGVRGEIAVRAPWVTRCYFERPAADEAAKMTTDDGGVWHRMGDVGYLDAEGRIWFCGRKDHRIPTTEGDVFPDPLEAVFDSHPEVSRSAVVPENGDPVLVVEGRSRPGLAEELISFGVEALGHSPIRRVRFHGRFPVDVRHNIKIDRPRLGRLLEGRP